MDQSCDAESGDRRAIRGDRVVADPPTRMIVVDSPERDTLSGRKLLRTDAMSAGDTFPRPGPGVTDMRHSRIIDLPVAKSSTGRPHGHHGVIERTAFEVIPTN